MIIMMPATLELLWHGWKIWIASVAVAKIFALAKKLHDDLPASITSLTVLLLCMNSALLLDSQSLHLKRFLVRGQLQKPCGSKRTFHDQNSFLNHDFVSLGSMPGLLLTRIACLRG